MPPLPVASSRFCSPLAASCHSVISAITGCATGAVEFGAVGVLEAEHVPAEFDDRELHPQADAEIRNLVLARETHRGDLAFDAALAEAAGHEDGVHARERMGAVLLDVGGFDVVHVDARAGLHAGVGQRLVQRDVAVLHLHVLADHGDVDLAVGVGLGGHHLLPLGEIGRRHVEPQLVDHDLVEALLVQQHRESCRCRRRRRRR